MEVDLAPWHVVELSVEVVCMLVIVDITSQVVAYYKLMDVLLVVLGLDMPEGKTLN